MSSATLTSAAPVETAPPAPPPPAARRARDDTDRSATSLLDESVHRLRRAPRGTLAVYYAGTLPFVLALLYFWADQGRNPDAEAHGSAAALGLALLFLWMKGCQAVFAARLAASIRREGRVAWTWGRLTRLAAVQTALQPSGLFALTVAGILIVPLGWVYAFYQNVTALGDGADPSIRAVFARAAHHALLRPKQNHAGLSVLTILAHFVWFNLIIMAFLLPQLAHMFTGEENLFTRSGAHFLTNTTFFAVTGALVYLALDPLAKTFYVLRCFYAESRRTGADLKSDLAALPPPATGAVALAILGAVCLALLPGQPACAADPAPAPASGTASTSPSSIAAQRPTSPISQRAAPSAPVSAPAPPPGTVSAPELGRSIEDVLRRREFAWRSPRAEKTVTDTGALDSFFDNFDRWWKERQKTMDGWFDRIGQKLRGWFRSRDQTKRDAVATSGPSAATLQTLIYALIAVLAAGLGFLAWRQLRGARLGVAEGHAAPAAIGPTPDLTDDSVLATQLPEDEWLRLARSLVDSGNRRLALRAFYLSILAGLGERGLLAIARHKSNRDYLLELRRRARDRDALQGAFARNVGRFERVWYGEHEADERLLSDFQADREVVLG